jgi:hypothetical protein
VLYSRGTDKAENVVLLLRSADHTQNISDIIAKHCWDVTSLRLCGSVFTEPLSRRGLHNPVVPLLVRFCGSTGLARSKYAIIYTALVRFIDIVGCNFPFFGLFYGASSISEYVTSSGRKTGANKKLEGFGKKVTWQNHSTPAISRRN